MPMKMPAEEPPPDAADLLIQSIPRMVHFSLLAVGAVAGFFYARQTQQENVVRCVIIGGACGASLTIIPVMLYKGFKLVLQGAALALLAYYVVYLPVTHQPPDLPGIIDAVWKWLQWFWGR